MREEGGEGRRCCDRAFRMRRIEADVYKEHFVFGSYLRSEVESRCSITFLFGSVSLLISSFVLVSLDILTDVRSFSIYGNINVFALMLC